MAASRALSGSPDDSVYQNSDNDTLIKSLDSFHISPQRNFSSSSTATAPASKVLSGSLENPAHQNTGEINALVKRLIHTPKVKRIKYQVTGTNMEVTSWKTDDYSYKRGKLPTYARGLFTHQDPDSRNHEVAVRGYDKFFNVGEVPRSRWKSIEQNTKGPYEVTLKENGCIIFMSGLRDGTLLVCSKHSTGVRTDVEVSHAMVGEKWIEKHLASVGKTKEDLARRLRDLNATAVAELCDDSFEEHILEYRDDRAGLYLHGINFNVPVFATCSAPEVHRFAEEWGFIKTDYFETDSVTELKGFLEDAAETGSWQGKDVEGFVIRCKARRNEDDPHWHDWFFKYKFDEPYLMYRQWRECTKAMLTGKISNPKKHVKVTKEYLAFAKQYFRGNPKAADEYKKNHGIIALRDAFLNARGAKGSDLVKEEAQVESGKFTNVVLVPVATIGCGKTTVAIALTKLFGWGHVQNDNITGKKRSVMFVKGISEELLKNNVVIADRNNHMRRERQQLISEVNKLSSDTIYVALHYNHYPDGVDAEEYLKEVREATADRVFTRGDNHQTIQASSQRREEVLGIMQGFLDRLEPVNEDSAPDSLFDKVIDLDPLAGSRVNLETVVDTLKNFYPSLVLKRPTAQEYDAAIQYALNEYSPSIKRQVKSGTLPLAQSPKIERAHSPQAKETKRVKTEYFALHIPKEPIIDALESAFSKTEPTQRSFYDHLKNSKRIQEAFHVTLIHRASTTVDKKTWEHYENAFCLEGDSNYDAVLGSGKIKLKRVVWDGRCMAFPVEFITNEESAIPCANKVPHITVGTGNPTIKPKETNSMLLKWKSGSDDNMRIWEQWLENEVVLEGSVKAFPSKF